jgi:hypothetical protein
MSDIVWAMLDMERGERRIVMMQMTILASVLGALANLGFATSRLNRQRRPEV